MRDIGRGLRRIELLLGDDLLGCKLSRAGEVSVCLVGVCAGRTDLRVESRALAGSALYLRLGLAGEAASASSCFGGGEIGLRLLQPHDVICIVQLDQQLAGVDVIVLVDADRLHVTANFCQNGHDVAIDLSVVGGLVRPAVAPFLECPEQENERDDADNGEDEFLFPRWLARLCRGGSAVA